MSDQMTGEQASTKPTLDDIASTLIEERPAKPVSAPRQPTRAKEPEVAEANDDDDDYQPPARQSAKSDDAATAGADDGEDLDDSDARSTGADDEDEDDFFDKLYETPETVDADAEDAPEGDEAGQTFKVKVDGKVKEVPLRDLLKAYSGEGAIEARLQQATEVRQRAEQEAQPFVQHAQALASRLQQVYDHYNQALFTPRVEAPDRSLLDTDPLGFVQQQEDYRADQERLRGEQAQMQQVLQQASQLHQQQVGQSLKQEFAALTTKLPKLKDPEIAKAFRREINKAAEHYGFKPEDVKAVMDHRLLLMAADAAAYRALKAKNGKAKTAGAAKRPEPSPPMAVKAGAAAVRRAGGHGTKQKERARAMEQARRSGKVEDVAKTLLL